MSSGSFFPLVPENSLSIVVTIFVFFPRLVAFPLFFLSVRTQVLSYFPKPPSTVLKCGPSLPRRFLPHSRSTLLLFGLVSSFYERFRPSLLAGFFLR